MIKRDNPRTVDGANYLVVRRVDSDDERVHLRRPLPWEGTDMLVWLYETEAQANAEISAMHTDTDAGEWEARGKARQYEAALQGRFIGLLWAHEHYDLEADGKSHPTPEEHGVAVYSELHAAGWDPEELDQLFQVCVKACVKAGSARVNKAGVDRIVSFGDAEDSKITPTSAPASNTSAAPVGSIN